MSFRYLAPAGSPIRAGDLFRWFGAAMAPEPAEQALAHAITDRFGVRYVTPVSTGRAALTLLLRAMRRIAGGERNEVVVPAYTCYSVPASIVKADLRPRIVDISPSTLDYAPEALAGVDFSRVLAVVATNLYGLPNDLPGLERLARRHGAFLIDDAAQALGGRVGGRWSGTWGDAGIFSFDKGKNVSAIDGGVIVTNSATVAAAVDEETAALAPPGIAQSAEHVLKAIAYSVLLRPTLYGLPARLPQLGLGRTVYTTEFPLARADRALMALGLTMLRRLDEFTAARRANAAAITAILRGTGLGPIAPRVDAEPAYLRLPVLAASASEQEVVIDVLGKRGLGATGSYPRSIADIPELQSALAPVTSADGGRDVARRIITLPTHPFVAAADLARMRAALTGESAAAQPSVVNP